MECTQLSLFGKTYREHSAPTAEKTSAPCWKNLPAWNSQTLLFLDLRGEADGAKPEQSLELDGALLGDSSTLNIGESPSVESESLLSQILEVNAPLKYYLSERACQGILTRASRRGKALPDLLKTALLKMIEWWQRGERNAAYTLKIRSGCAGGGKGALVQTEKTGTLSMIQDQTLFQPVIYDARGNDGGQIVPTVTGDHESKITDYTAIAVDLYNGAVTGDITTSITCRSIASHSGPQVMESYGIGRDNVREHAGCLTPWDSQGRRVYDENGIFPSLQAREKAGGNQQTVLTKTSGDRKDVRWVVRRLTPMECERLQGYPDGWTDIGEWTDTKGKKHKAADSPRYKALGNSIALPQWFWIAQKTRPYMRDSAKLGSLFDGIGGFPLVWEATYGTGTARWASEIEEFPIAVTKLHFPEREVQNGYR